MKKLKDLFGFLLLLGLFLFYSNGAAADDQKAFSYDSPKTYEVGVAITSLSPTISGSGYTFSISPDLPNGLVFNTSTGVISGTPNVLSLANTYTITATNEQGSKSFDLTLASLFKPASFDYSIDPVRFFTINRNITDTLTASKNQTGVTYSTSPDLPSGVSINPLTGEIGGFATEISGLTSYVVTASNPLGAATTTVSIAVPMPWTGVGNAVTASGASYPFLGFNHTNNTYTPYVIYTQSSSSIIVAKYDSSSKSWIQVGNAITGSASEQDKITFDSNGVPYISYISNGSLFIRKYNSFNNKWESLSSLYANGQESGSSLSNTTVFHDTSVNQSNNAYEAYVSGGQLNVVKLINNPAEYSTIDNLEDPSALTDFSYGTSSVVFGTGSKINPLFPSISGKPTTFKVFPLLPAGLKIGNDTDGAGVIYGTPLVASDATDYTITASNELGSATTSIRIKTVGPWTDLTTGIFSSSIIGESMISKAVSGDFYLSSFSSGENIFEGTDIIRKYDVSSSSWKTIYSCDKSSANQSKSTMNIQLVGAMTTKGDDLYIVLIDSRIDFSDENNPQISSISYLKKYDASEGVWTTLGESDSLINPIMDNQTSIKLAFSGDDLFVASFTYDGYISVYQFDYQSGSFGSGSIADFSANHSFGNNDNSQLIGDDNHLYLAYSDIGANNDSGNVVVKIFDKTAGSWSEYTDNLASINLSGSISEISVDSFKVGGDGHPYISYRYSGNYRDLESETDIGVASSLIRELDPGSGDFTTILSEDSNDNRRNIISFDNEGVLWSSSGGIYKIGYTIRKYVSGQWVSGISGAQFSSPNINIGNPELFFDSSNKIYTFMNKYVSSLARYDGTEAPINYDYSTAPSISYPKQSFTYVTGKRIEPLCPTIVGSSAYSSDVDVKVLTNSGLPNGLYFSNAGVIYGKPLVATTTVVRMSVSNTTGSSSVDIILNTIDPWVPLSGSLSSSSQSVSLGVGSDSHLYIAYSESANSINRVIVKKYENESWQGLGGQVSDEGVSASYPKLFSYYGRFYVAYLEDVSGKLIVKKYDGESGSWTQIGDAVSDHSSKYFNISGPLNSDEVLVIYYDDVNNRSIVKSYHNGYWEIRGGYLEQGHYPSLSPKDNKIYAVYSDNNGALKVVSHEEIGYNNIGKDVSLEDIDNLIENGDMSPQGGVSATSTTAVKFNQKINITPFAGASISIPSGEVMTASEPFDTSILTASSSVNLTGISSAFNPAGTLMFGLPSLGLTLNDPITINIPISGIAENTLLQVYSKTAGSSWSPLTSCYVIAGKCSFQTTHLSEFAAGTVTVSNSNNTSSGGGGGSAIAPTCSSVTYSDFWSVCVNGYQFRNYLSQSPTGCSLSASQIEEARRLCQISTVDNNSSNSSTTSSSTTSIIKTAIKEAQAKFVELEKTLVKKINKILTSKLLGRILLQVEGHGEAWYLDPISSIRYYLADGDSAYSALRRFGFGIKNADIAKIPVGQYSYQGAVDSDFDGLSDKVETALGTDPNKADSDGDGVKDSTEILKNGTNPLNKTKLSYSRALASRLKGRILIQTERNGEAWYVNPVDGKRYYLADGEMAYQVMRYLSLGVNNANLRQIKVGEIK